MKISIGIGVEFFIFKYNFLHILGWSFLHIFSVILLVCESKFIHAVGGVSFGFYCGCKMKFGIAGLVEIFTINCHVLYLIIEDLDSWLIGRPNTHIPACPA